jgi:hypothetical protein
MQCMYTDKKADHLQGGYFVSGFSASSMPKGNVRLFCGHLFVLRCGGLIVHVD